MDVTDECRIQKCLGFYPKIIPGFALSLGVRDQRRDQLQNVFFAVNIREGIVTHGLFEVDGVEDFNAVAPAPQELSAFHNDAALWVRDNKAGRVVLGITLHQIGLYEKPCLAGAGAANNEDVFISGCFGVLWSAVHGESFRLRENDVVFKNGVDVRLDVLGPAPAGGAIFHVFTELLGVPASDVDRQPEGGCEKDAHGQIRRMKAGQRRGKGSCEAVHQVKELSGSVRACGQPPRLSELGGKQCNEQIWQIHQEQPFCFCVHRVRSCSLCFTRSMVFTLTSSLNCWSRERTEGLFARSIVFAVNSVKAAVSASASRPLKKTRYLGGDTLRSFLTA
ncbi:hypothetical protein SDC9_138055 [bioreactor metagenome]|uniref:Uncharacterized protein n=1 Tax=bioreactor metagenome TaxID=1076179 RepID=A0A645DR20_9ZZZZ